MRCLLTTSLLTGRQDLTTGFSSQPSSSIPGRRQGWIWPCTLRFFHAGHQEPAHFQAERRDTLNFHGNTAAMKAGHELFPAVAQEDSLGSGLAARGPGTDSWGSLLKRLWAVLQGMPPCPCHLHTYWLKPSSRIQWGSLEMGQPERMGCRPQSTSGCRLLSASAGRTTMGTTKLGLKPRNLGNLLAPLIAPAGSRPGVLPSSQTATPFPADPVCPLLPLHPWSG